MPKTVVFSQPNCKWCDKAKALLDELGVEYELVDISASDQNRRRFDHATNGAKTVPQVMVDDLLIGGFTELSGIHNAGKFLPLYGILTAPRAVQLHLFEDTP